MESLQMGLQRSAREVDLSTTPGSPRAGFRPPVSDEPAALQIWSPKP